MRLNNLLIIGVVLTLISCKVGNQQEEIDVYSDVEFEMPKVTVPEFPNYHVVITDFGAVGDGHTLNSDAINKAISHVAGKGGGKVIIPRGVWLTGPIVLKSNINLHAEDGALVIFSKNKDLYPLEESFYEGKEDVRCQSPISGRYLENIAFTGEGIYDGSGEAWRKVKRYKMTDKQWNDLMNTGGVTNDKGTIWYTSDGHKKGEERNKSEDSLYYKSLADYMEIRDFFRPVMVSLINCDNVLLDGPVFQNSPNWCLHPLMCENVTVRNVDVRNPWYSQNGDGIDIESCKNAVVYNCTFDVGDDAICIKSGKDKSGRDRGKPSENIIVKNCVVYHGHGGIVVGSEMSGGVKNLHASNCTFIGTDVGIRFKSRRGRGGIVEKIFISNIDMINIPTNAISFNLYYQNKSVSEMLADNDQGKIEETIYPITVETPQFKDISIKDITCKGAYQAIYLQGLPEMNLENVSLENLNMSAENGLTCIDANGVQIKNLQLKTQNYPAINFYNAINVGIEDLSIVESDMPSIEIKGEKTANISIELVNADKSDRVLQMGNEVNKEEITLK